MIAPGEGKLKWFKHYSNCKYSEGLIKLEDELGLEGYARYWKLLELLAENFDGKSDNFVISSRVLRQCIRVRSGLHLQCFLDVLALHLGYTVNKIGNNYEIKAPILLELQSRDFKKARTDRAPTAPKNKIKNKKKNIYSKNSETDVSSSRIKDAWNSSVKTLPRCQTISDRRAIALKRLLRDYTPEQVIDAFSKVEASDFLTGRNEKWTNCSIDWVLKPDNFLKIIEGVYDNRTSKNPEPLKVLPSV